MPILLQSGLNPMIDKMLKSIFSKWILLIFYIESYGVEHEQNIKCCTKNKRNRY